VRKEFKHAIEEAVDVVAVKLAEQKERFLAVPGRLPVAKIWRPESVSYQAEFVAHEGSLYQARRDTAQSPGGSDWVCVARAGHDGLTPKFRGAFDAYQTYARLDVVGQR
jgi:hypothetical protein